jgi:hypothetical protein
MGKEKLLEGHSEEKPNHQVYHFKTHEEVLPVITG